MEYATGALDNVVEHDSQQTKTGWFQNHDSYTRRDGVGLLVCWSAGLLVCWSAGLLVVVDLVMGYKMNSLHRL